MHVFVVLILRKSYSLKEREFEIRWNALCAVAFLFSENFDLPTFFSTVRMLPPDYKPALCTCYVLMFLHTNCGHDMSVKPNTSHKT